MRPIGSLAAVAAFALVAPATSRALQQDMSGVEIEATHVAGNVYMLVGRGGNIGVSSGPDGTLIVDDQFAPLADRIRAALAEIGQTPDAATVRFVLNTHWHGDHTGGNAVFGRDATIIAHDNVRRRLSTRQDRGEGRVTEASPAEALPVITFEESLSVHFNGERIGAFHMPSGHTDGDAVVYFMGSNVIHMGDDFFPGRFPFVDLASGGSVEGVKAAVAEVLEHIGEDTAVIPGHGPLSTVEDLRVYHRMLEETIADVRGKMADGKTLEEIQAEGVPAAWASWGEGDVFISGDRWLETIYRSLSDARDSGGAAGPSDSSHGGNYDRAGRGGAHP